MGIAGLVDRKGVLQFAPNLPGVVGFDVGGGRGRRPPGWPRCRWTTTPTARRVAEHRVGAGVGRVATSCWSPWARASVAAVIIGDRLVRGASGFAGEPGHMVVDPNGPRCPCGRRGCWERFASGSGLGRLARDAAEAGAGRRHRAPWPAATPRTCGASTSPEAAADGDPEALEVLREFAWWVALGISNLENLLDPEVVVIGGGLAEAGELLLAPTRAAYPTLVLGYEHRPSVRIVAAELGPDAGAIGAGLLVLDTLRPWPPT